jgi:anaerobic ribonucleoside-triphosphate reductase
MDRITKINEDISNIEAKLADPNLGKGTVETSSRITGYYRPIENFNPGKQQEFSERQEYSIK